MPPDPNMRAADTDRDRVAAALREHCAQGRLTVEELEERLDATYAAKTFGELRQVTADLPEEDMYQLPVPARQQRGTPATAAGRALSTRGMGVAWASWAAVSTVTFVIWLVVGIAAGQWVPWWLWVAVPWGIGLAVRQRARSGRPRQH
jgi:hypothetical protein